MLEDVRKSVRGFVEAGMAAVSGALTPSRARDLARSMTRGEGADQVNRIAQDLLEWSQRSREWIGESVQREVKRQLSALGVATREDLDALRKRVRELERPQGSKRGKSSTSGAKTSSPKRAPKKTTSSGKPKATAADTVPPTGPGDAGASST
jgi:polyhydroxyalkanoate synthesis regulator phasin